MNHKLLLVEDDLTFSTMLSTWLRKKGFDVETASSVGAAIKLLLHESVPTRLVLSDLRLPDHDGLHLLEWLHRQGRTVPFILLTSYAEVGNAVEAMKRGATDYLSKPVQPDVLLGKINEALNGTTAITSPISTAPAEKVVSASPVTPTKTDAHHTVSSEPAHKVRGIEGNAPTTRELYRLASLVAPTPMSVLIIGASGTGKEYVAHRIHEQSQRSNGPFVAIDCGSLTKELAASELFGHVKGAFTGATSDKTGAFEQASGGTLFLDEIGNLSYDVQVQLLRALQERRIRPVGCTDERPVDIRLVSATNENLPEAIARGTYREDLYHRINEFTLHMPLLRDRGEDILEFARYFLKQANKELGRCIDDFTFAAQDQLLHYPWPGNLREMRNVIVRAALLAESRRFIDTTELGLHLTHTPGLSAAMSPNNLSIKPSADNERERILEALRQTQGNKSRAAQLLGVDRKTLYNKLKSLGIEG